MAERSLSRNCGHSGRRLAALPRPISSIRILRETDDGFRIAEEDLRLRGAGELLGTRQSGFPEFRLADPSLHDAQLILHRDPRLESERGQALRLLLYLFERDAAVKYLRSG